MTAKRIGIAMLLAVLFTGCGHKQKEAEKASQAPLKQATLITVEKSDKALLMETPGTLVSEQRVEVASRLTGFIRDIRVREGQAVNTGQVLLRVDSADIEGQIAQTESALAQAQAALADAENDHQRFSALYKEEAVPKAQFDKVDLQYRLAQQQVAAGKAALDTAKSQLRYANVTTPISGVVVAKLADAGDLATPGTPLLVIENPGRLQAETQVQDSLYGQLETGESVQVVLDSGIDVEGHIARLVPAADPSSHTHLVKIDVPSRPEIRSGGLVRVRFAVGSRPALRVPAQAVQMRAGISGVFVVDREGIVRFRMVRTGIVEGDSVEIQAGLTAGERIASEGADKLENGDRVGGV
jgi:membrane fusion protein, multidrug efflux system